MNDSKLIILPHSLNYRASGTDKTLLSNWWYIFHSITFNNESRKGLAANDLLSISSNATANRNYQNFGWQLQFENLFSRTSDGLKLCRVYRDAKKVATVIKRIMAQKIGKSFPFSVYLSSSLKSAKIITGKNFVPGFVHLTLRSMK